MSEHLEQSPKRMGEDERREWETALKAAEEKVSGFKEQIATTDPNDKKELARLHDELAGQEAAVDSLKNTLAAGEFDTN